MKARYQYRFYPTEVQKVKLAQLFGCIRVVWNDALAVCKKEEKKPSYNTLSSLLTQSKQTEERKWLKEVSCVPLQQSLRNQEVAFRNFFESCKKKRKGKKVAYPKFKKKSNKQSAEFTNSAFKLKGTKVYLAKIGLISPIWSRELSSLPSSATVIKDTADRYFISFVVEVEALKIPVKNKSVGIDLGIKTFATLSTGEKFRSPSYSKLYKSLGKLQRSLSKKKKGSNRRNKARTRVAKKNIKIAEVRKDFLYKLSTKVMKENQLVILEDLKVSEMLQDRRLSKLISQQGWREFRCLCEAKANKFNREFQVINQWEPTSQVCSVCGYKWGKLNLRVRKIKCLECGAEHDRDENAAKNIKQVATGHWETSKTNMELSCYA